MKTSVRLLRAYGDVVDARQEARAIAASAGVPVGVLANLNAAIAEMSKACENLVAAGLELESKGE